MQRNPSVIFPLFFFFYTLGQFKHFLPFFDIVPFFYLFLAPCKNPYGPATVTISFHIKIYLPTKFCFQ
jgi:hypothetical protein